MPQTNKKNQITLLVNFILDVSGSMEAVQEATISGFNEYLGGLKKREEKVLFSLTLFNTVVKEIYTLKPIKEVPALTKKTYNPDGGTALYDASVETIEKSTKMIDEIKGKTAVLTVIMTDGQENSSTRHNEGCLKDLMKKLEKEGKWTFVFLGANQNSWATTANWGVSTGNVANWTFSSSGIQNAFQSLGGNTANYMCEMSSNAMQGKSLKVDNFNGGTK